MGGRGAASSAPQIFCCHWFHVNVGDKLAGFRNQTFRPPPTLTLSTPFRILPPATPPFKSSTSQPGLFTSNDLMTAARKTFTLLSVNEEQTKRKARRKKEGGALFPVPMSLGSDVKSLTGTGIFLTMYSQTTSMLYFSCAEIGMMGAPSATVPAGQT